MSNSRAYSYIEDFDDDFNPKRSISLAGYGRIALHTLEGFIVSSVSVGYPALHSEEFFRKNKLNKYPILKILLAPFFALGAILGFICGETMDAFQTSYEKEQDYARHLRRPTAPIQPGQHVKAFFAGTLGFIGGIIAAPFVALKDTFFQKNKENESSILYLLMSMPFVFLSSLLMAPFRGASWMINACGCRDYQGNGEAQNMEWGNNNGTRTTQGRGFDDDYKQDRNDNLEEKNLLLNNNNNNNNNTYPTSSVRNYR